MIRNAAWRAAIDESVRMMSHESSRPITHVPGVSSISAPRCAPERILRMTLAMDHFPARGAPEPSSLTGSRVS